MQADRTRLLFRGLGYEQLPRSIELTGGNDALLCEPSLAYWMCVNSVVISDSLCRLVHPYSCQLELTQYRERVLV